MSGMSSAAPRAMALKSLVARPYILGPDLPDVWTSLNSGQPPPPSPTEFHCCDNELIPTIIDGNSIADEIRSGVAEEVRLMKNAIKKVTGLAVILVGERRDSQTYVRNKTKACQEAGITSLMAELLEHCAEDEVVNAISSFIDDPSVHGILVQLPLPQHMDEEKILSAYV